MAKKLSEMTLEELWQLFPINLVRHKAVWKENFLSESKDLKKYLPENTDVYHIGSSAIDNIMAKPIVDILVEIDESNNLLDIAERLQKECGYIIMSVTDVRISLNKGYTENGYAEKVFHLHLQHEIGKREVYFCAYLNAYPEIAKEYENLKITLAEKYKYDRDAYTSAKSDFINKYTDIAIKEFN